MILIQDGYNPIKPGDLTGTAQLVYTQKMASPIRYTYRTAQDLLFELQLRTAIVESAQALNASGVSFSSFANSRSNPAYWTRTYNGGFLMRPDVRPSAAIRDIFQYGGAYAFECAMAIVIVLYKAVLDTIGDAEFDRLFANLYLYSWEHDADLHLTTVKGIPESFPGDVLYYSNPDFDPQTPQWQGENVVKLPASLLYGHGIGIAYEADIIRELNRRRRPGSLQPAYLLDQATYPDFAAIRAKVSGGSAIPAAAAPHPEHWVGGQLGSHYQYYA